MVSDPKQVQAMRAVVLAILETVNEVQPCPEGAVYAGLMAHGLGLGTYSAIVAGLVDLGMLERVAPYCLKATAKARAMLAERAEPSMVRP